MTKRLQITLLSVFAALLCVAMIFGAALPIAFAAEGETTEPATPEQPTEPTTPSDDVLVFDDISYFNTIDNGDGTFTIKGGVPGSNKNGWGNLMVENGLSAKAYCELIGEDYDPAASYDCASLIERIWNGEAKGKKFKISIPANVSKIENYAFGLRVMNLFIIFGFNSIDVEDEDMNAPVPALVEIEFAQIDGKRALTANGFGGSLFGSCPIQKLTVPKEFEEWDYTQSENQDFGSPFYGMFMPEIDLATEQLTKIPSYAFHLWYVDDLEMHFSLDIPEGITEIGTGAFFEAYSLTEVSLPSSLKKIGENAFGGTQLGKVNVNSLKHYFDIERVNDVFDSPFLLYIDGQAQDELVITGIEEIPENVFNGYACTKVTIMPDVKVIGRAAFKNCSELIDLTLPEGIRIGSSSFSGCKALKTLNVPAGAIFDYGAFEYCNSLTAVNVDSWETWCGIKFGLYNSNPLTNKSASLYVDGVKQTEVVLPSGINSIPNFAFIGPSFTSFTIHSAVTEIGEGAFRDATNLKEIILPESLQTIGIDAFKSTGISELIIPNSVTSIGNYALRDCKSLTYVKLPEGLTVIPNGLLSDCTALKTVNIPIGVKTIEPSAFSKCTALESIDLSFVETIGGNAFNRCTSLKTVTLRDLKTVNYGDSSSSSHFYLCTSLETITIPEGVTSLAGYMFNGCTALKTVHLPSSINSIPSTAFANCPNVKIVTNSKADYENVKTLLGGSAVAATYPVKLSFFYNGLEVASNQSLYFGDTYGLELPSIGKAWYIDEACTVSATAEALTEMLSSAEVGDEIVLYSNSLTTKLLYAKDNLVYDGKEYALDASANGVNKLLTDYSDKIIEGMKVEIVSFTLPNGEQAAVLPAAVSNAGTYVLQVSGDDFDPVNLTIVIAPQTLELSDYANLGWKISGVGSDETDIELNGATLYVYMYGQGQTYASLTPLDTNSGKYQGYVLYAVREVKHSVARYRGENVSLTISVGSAKANAFTVTSAENDVSTANGCGMYLARVIITANPNYLFRVGSTSDLNERGVRFILNDDGSYTVEKTWYVVDVGNYLVSNASPEGGDYNDYSIASGWTFGSAPSITIPYARYGDVNASQFGAASDPLTMTLRYGSTTIGQIDFKRSDFSKYFNASMPAGRYTLVVKVRAIVGEDKYDAIEYSYEFTVNALALPQTELKALVNALKGTFTFNWDGSMHLVKSDVAQQVAALKTAVENATPERSGVWAEAKYNDYYGMFAVAYNLDRMHSSEYFTENDLNDQDHKPVDPDRYVVYYLISASNFVSSVDDALSASEYDAVRREYVFYVTIIREIALPTVSSVTYNGSAQKADIICGEFYAVDDYAGFTEAGAHSVTLRLFNTEFYRWAGKELGEATATVSFEITKALNEWVESADIVRWIEGNFNEEENGFIGASKFGNIVYVITDIDDNVIYDAAQGIDNRASMKAGAYILKATVAGNDNYNGLSESFTIRILEKLGMPWWGTTIIAVGSLAVAAAIILILWKLKVFEILTDKISLAITTRATVDATIAAVRASKTAEEAQAHVNKVKARERLEAAREAERNKTPEQKAQELAAKAEVTATKADKMHAKANKLRERADKLAGKEQQAADAQDESAEQTDDTSTEE